MDRITCRCQLIAKYPWSVGRLDNPQPTNDNGAALTKEKIHEGIPTENNQTEIFHQIVGQYAGAHC